MPMAFGKRVESNVPSSLQETPSHFFKVILRSTLKDKKLLIPQKFASKLGHELCDAATLIVPNGGYWRVGLKKDGGNIWFCNGWHEFVKSHSVSAGCFLVFKYGKNSIFHVLIFDLTGCEINYIIKGEESENVKQNSQFQNDMEREDSEQIIGAATPKNKHFDECSSKGVFSKMNCLPAPQNRAKDALGSAWRIGMSCPSAASFENPKMKHKCEPQCKKCKREEINESDDHNKYDLCALLGEMRIFITRRHGLLSAEESKRAVNFARSLKLKNPSFMVMLRSYELCRGLVYVPAQFAKKFFSRNVKCIKLQSSNERELSVQINWRSRGGLYLNNGWVKFSKAWNLKERDICIFELIRTKDVLLNVFVYQHEEELENMNYPPAHQNWATDSFGSVQQFKRKRQSADASPENSKIEHKCEPQMKKCKIEESVENESDSDNDSDLLALLGEMGIFITERCGLLSAEQSKRAISVARSLKPKNPSFMVILQSRNIDRSEVYVPAKFANKFMSRDATSIKVQASDERAYLPIQIRWKLGGGFSLTKGWAEFSKDKNLKEGDICIFELITAKDVLLKLSVFHG